MATIWDPTKDEQQKQSMGAGAPPPTPTGTSGTGTQGTSGTAKPTGSGQFTNLQSYIRANENTDAGKQVGSGVLGVADNAMKTASTEVGKLTSMTPGAGPAQMDKGDQTWLESQQPGVGEPDWRNAAANQSKFEGLKTKYGAGAGSYSGPSTQDVSNQIAAAQNAQTAAANQANVLQGGNSAGRSELLKSTYGKDKQYSGGENKLDSFLLERNFGDQFAPKFEQLKGQLTAQETAGKTAGDKLSGDVPKIQKEFTDTNEKWRKLLEGAGTTTAAASDTAATRQAESEQMKLNALNDAVMKQSQDATMMADWDQWKAAGQRALDAKDYSGLAQILRDWQAKYPGGVPSTGDNSLTGSLFNT